MDTYKQYYDRLNSEQKRVVDAVDGPLLVLAGPGTGKTQLLSVRAANILKKKKILPENILILTFTNAAAREMRDRLACIVGHKGYNVEVETFHSFANSIVLESEGAIRYVKDKIEMSEVEKVRALEYIIDNTEGIKELRPFGAPYIHRREIETKISELKNEGIYPEEMAGMLRGIEPDGVNLEQKHLKRLKELSLIYENYERLKDMDAAVLFDERGRIDYDDMILIALDALKKDSDLRDGFRGQYKYIMVDEYQDTNGAQLELLFSIMDSENPNICCVGDDDQAIYRFQGATLANFRVLEDRLPGLKKVTLKDNYRSTQDIIDLSGQIISQLPEEERIAVKKLRSRRELCETGIDFLEFMTEEEEMSYIVGQIKKQAEAIRTDPALSEEERGKPYNNIAVLVRKRAYILKIIDAFLQAGIPYATDGAEDIRQEKRVRQMLDVLQLASLGTENMEKRSLALYKVLVSDYVSASHSDILKFIAYCNAGKRASRQKEDSLYASYNLYQKFTEHFGQFVSDNEGKPFCPEPEESEKLDIARKLGLEKPYSLHRAAWAIERLVSGAADQPVHDLLLRYVNDMRIYGYILTKYEEDQVLRVRDLRALVSFINMVKQADLANPALGLDEFMNEMELREVHGIPIKGEMATLSQDGVRVYTAHASKGQEFHTVFLPFCLQHKSWPVRKKGEVVRIPPQIYKSREKVDEKEKIKLLDYYDELRLFYVASSRAKARVIYTATPAEKVIISQFFEDMKIEPELASPSEEEEFLANFLKQVEKPDPFEGTAVILRDMVKRLSLNPTSLNNYLQCKRKFLYDNVLLLPGRKNQHLVFGNCAHKALEVTYTEFMGKGRFPAFSVFREAFKKELGYEGVSDTIKTWCYDKLDQLEDWYSRQSREPVMPVDLENKLEVSLPEGLVFRGTFDKIEREAPGEIKVVDYKTGKPDKHVKAIANCRDVSRYECDDYYRQLIAYKMLYERAKGKRLNEKVTKGVLQFLEKTGRTIKKYSLEKGAYREEVVELADSMVEEFEKVLMRCWRSIQALDFDKLPERDPERCGRCEYEAICWED
ncbi:MAG: AAA family ATPase [Candidatus Omnitrophica bacterium]|nr:AAA family ATPase [Candidatus Omnitrophota bacterium]